MTGYADQTVQSFLDELGSDAPTPGGGSCAAMVGAHGASLVRMLARLTLGRKKYEAHQELMEAIADQAAEGRDAFLQLALDDASAYDAVSAAFKLPRETDEDKTARATAIQDAMKGACEVPLKVMEQCLEIIGLAKNAVLSGNKNALSDGAAGAEFCRSALKVASYNVKINLLSIKDAEYVKLTQTRLDEMYYMGTAVANEIDSHVNELWKPKPAAT